MLIMEDDPFWYLTLAMMIVRKPHSGWGYTILFEGSMYYRVKLILKKVTSRSYDKSTNKNV